MASLTSEKYPRVVSRYLDQPSALPSQIRNAVESRWSDDPVELYASIDLDEGFRLTERWLCVGPRQIAIVTPRGEAAPEILSLDRSAVARIQENPGLSAVTLALEDVDGNALAVLRYSYRQRTAVGAIIFVLQQALEGNTAVPPDGDTAYARSLAEPILQAQASVAETQMSVFTRLLTYLKPYWGRVTAGMLGGVLLTLLSILPPVLTGYFLDRVLTPYEENQLAWEKAWQFGGIFLGALVVIFVLRDIMIWVRLRTMAMVGELVARDLRRELYDHLHTLSVRYFSKEQTGGIISRVSSDTDRIWDFIAFGVTELTLSLLTIVGVAVAMFLVDWQLALVLIIPLPVIFFLIFLMGKLLHRVFLRIWRKWSAMTAVLSDTIPGIRVVKAFSQEDHERQRFNRRNDEVLDEAFAIHRAWTTFWPMIYFGISLLTILLWVAFLPRYLGTSPGEEVGLTAGVLATFLLLMGMFVAPIENIGFLTRMVNRSLSSAHRVFEILDTEPDITEKENPVRLEPVRGDITFEEVTFGYEPVRQVIKGISFDVKEGEMVGLVGPSGAGKSTVLNLITRFYEPTSGQVLIDGQNVRDLDLGHFRRQIGMVLQDPYLFHGTVIDNIRYGHHAAGLDDVIAAARAANAHDFIMKLPHGYETIVGERGHTLSGGERQRVSIARAILHNPRILLLDEATSSVDTETERKIQEAIDRLVQGRTVLAIAHRLSTLSRANRLLVMKDGRIVESGTHEELLALEDGVYTRLHRLQRELHEMYAV